MARSVSHLRCGNAAIRPKASRCQIVRSMAWAALLGGLNLIWPQLLLAQTLPIELTPAFTNGSRFDVAADGQYAVIAGDGAELWDISRRRLVRRFGGSVVSVAISGDHKFVAAGDSNGSATVWDATSGKELAKFRSKGSVSVNAIAFLPGGRIVYGGDGKSKNIHIADISTQAVLKNFASGWVAAIAASPRGNMFAVGDWDSYVRIFSSDGRPIKAFRLHSTRAVNELSFSADGRFLISGGYQDHNAYIWDTASWKKIATLSFADDLDSASWSADGKFLAVTSGFGLSIFDASSWKRIKNLEGQFNEVEFIGDEYNLLDSSKIVDIDGNVIVDHLGPSAAHEAATFLDPGSKTVLIEHDGRLYHFDILTGETSETGENIPAPARFTASPSGDMLYSDQDWKPFHRSPAGAVTPLEVEGDGGETLFIARNGKFGLHFSIDTASIFDLTRNMKVWSFHNEHSNASVDISSDGRYLYTNGTFNVTSWDIINKKMVAQADVPVTSGDVYLFTDERSILVVNTDQGKNYAARIYSAPELKIVDQFVIPGRHHFNHIYNAALSPDGSTVALSADDGIIHIWDLRERKLSHSLSGSRESAWRLIYSADGKRLISANAEGIRLWDPTTGELLASHFLSTDGEWITITPEGFFTASPNGANNLSVVRGLDVFSVDQVYQVLYRPDLVREKLAGDPNGIVREAAARLDLTAAIGSGAPPVVDVVSPGADAVFQDSVTAEISLEDKGGGVGRVEWRVNGVTARVVEAGGEMRQVLPLEPGDNLIEVVAYNAKNLVASTPASLKVHSDAPANAMPRLHVLAIGVNDYWDSRLQLAFAVPDARAVGEALRQAGNSDLYESVDVMTVEDAAVTKDGLDRAFAAMGARVRARDVFVLFVAGHAKTVAGRYFFIPHDFRYESEQSVPQQGIGQDLFQTWLARIPAKKSILLYDTCESGSLTGGRIAQRGMERVVALEKMTRAMGRTILSAATDDQPAIEGYRGHGVFTYAVLQALGAADGNADGMIQVTELAGYVDRKVPEYSFEAFKQRQIPQMSIVGSDFPLGASIAALVDLDPTTPPIPTKPTHVVIAAAPVRDLARGDAPGQTELPVGTLVVLIESSDGWALVARDGKMLGYVNEKALARLHWG
ncbi:caspase family protein [Mesorhizobium sp. M0991]|uniref:caspase family protein n=1 Tax=Mesorhizobium sp. M0991 TaxID=2957043 RepID=UPI00333B0613